MVEPLRHRQTKGADNEHARPKATAPHPYSTLSSRCETDWEGQQRGGQDPFAKPPANARYLREAAPRRL